MLKQGSEFENRMVNSLELAGNAAYEEDAHTAFLLFAIALESGVLGRETKEELTFQLAMRVAHLVGTDLRARRTLFKKVKELYGKRSKIVHTGSRDVTARDVNEIRFICLASLLSICDSTAMSSFTKSSELEDWFQEKMLSAEAPDEARDVN